MSNLARDRSAQAPVPTSEAGTPNRLHCALTAEALQGQPQPLPLTPSPGTPHTGGACAPQSSPGAEKQESELQKQRVGEKPCCSCQDPWGTEKTGGIRCHSCAGLDCQSRTESGDKRSFVFSWNAPAISRASPTTPPARPTRCSAGQKGQAGRCQKISCYLKISAGDRTCCHLYLHLYSLLAGTRPRLHSAAQAGAQRVCTAPAGPVSF